MSARLTRLGVAVEFHERLALFGLSIFHVCLLEHAIDKAIIAAHREDAAVVTVASPKLPMRIAEKVQLLGSYLAAKADVERAKDWVSISIDVSAIFERRKVLLHGGFLGWPCDPVPPDHRYLFVKLESDRTPTGATTASLRRSLVKAEDLEDMIERSKVLVSKVEAAFPIIEQIDKEILDGPVAANLVWAVR